MISTAQAELGDEYGRYPIQPLSFRTPAQGGRLVTRAADPGHRLQCVGLRS